MPRHKEHLPLINDQDNNTWREAVAFIQKLGARPARPNSYQLKINNVSYYPGTGTIFIDGDSRALPEHGLRALERLLTKRKSASGNGGAKHHPQREAADTLTIEEPDLIIEEPNAD